MSLRARLLVLVALATVVPAVLAGVRFFEHRTSEIEAALVNLSAAATNIANDLDGKIQGTAQLQYGLVRARDLDTRDKAACSNFLSAIREEYPQYTGMLTIEPDGSLFCDSLQTGRMLDLRDRNYFRRALEAYDTVTLEPVFGRLTGSSVLQIAYPARSNIAQLKYVLLASFNLQSFADYHSDRLSRGTAVLIVDKHGVVLVRPAFKDWFTQTAASIADTDLFRFATKQAAAHAGEVRGLDGEMQVWAVASSPAVRDAGIYFMVGRPKQDLLAAANARLGEDLTTLAAVSLLLFVGVWTFADLSFRRPLRRIADMASKLGQGDLSVRIAPPLASGELGGLMRMLNGTAMSLERQRDSIHDLNRRLHQSEKMQALGQLTGGLAHDFNNLLTVILGNAEHLAAKLSKDAALRTFADGTVAAAERGAELTKSLLAFSRQQPLVPKDIDVGRQIAGMESMLRQTLGSRIEFVSILGSDVWPAAIDPAQFEAAVLNIAINARDAMPEGGSLTLETRNAPLDKTFAEANVEVLPGDFVMVAVTDTGAGMAPDVVARAFEPFFTTKGVGKGTGLGLSMAYGFMKQSGGTMKIYSEPGHGTIVKLYLPRAGTIPAMDEASPGSIALTGGNESILVVEDDDMVRSHVERELEELGYHVILARNGAAALDILGGAAKVDLLFTDVVMAGGMFGPQLAEKALLMRPDLKVLYTSGYTENALVQSSRLGRGIKLLNKPYRRQGLADMLRSVLTPH